MQWDKAGQTAAAIAAEWNEQAGPGGAILLFDAERIRTEACGGQASLERPLPFTSDTAVRYASISKHFLCALLAKTGLIDFKGRLGDHLKLTPALSDIPVGRALDMTAGIADAMETLWLLGVPPTASIGRDALLRFVSGFSATNFPTGTEISYSNSGYRLVQAALEAKGTDYKTALRENFFAPLGLSIRLPYDETEPVPELARGYWRGPLGWQHGRYGLHYSASGGLAGSARDLATWAQALLTGRGPLHGILPLLSAPRDLIDGQETGYRLGLATSPVPGLRALGHGGSLPGLENHFLLAPEAGAGVVIVSNREDTDAHGIALRVMAALAGTALTTPVTDALPQGLFVEPEGPIWMEHAAGVVTYLGATETLYPGSDGYAEGRSVHMPTRLRMEGREVVGRIGHVARRFVPVAAALRHPRIGRGTGWRRTRTPSSMSRSQTARGASRSAPARCGR